MSTFKHWKKLFDNNSLLDFSRTTEGLLWLKLRSIDRKDLLAEFCADIGLQDSQRVSAEMVWQRKAECMDFESRLNGFMLKCQKRENKNLEASTEAIRSNLYRMTHFHWGGGFRNSLDKAIVSKYVKTDSIKDSANSSAMSVLSSIASDWARVIESAIAEKRDLIRWLYENQGDMRFGAENRVFLVLVDMANPDDSWKLKRNADLIAPEISRWVSGFRRERADELLTRFSYKSKLYEAYADVIFLVKR